MLEKPSLWAKIKKSNKVSLRDVFLFLDSRFHGNDKDGNRSRVLFLLGPKGRKSA